MAVTLAKVKKLLTSRESDFASSVSPSMLTELTPAKLRTKLAQARKLRKKYEDLARRQRRESRGKAAPRGKRPAESNQNTKLKAEYFEQLESRIAAKLEKAEASADSKRPAAKTAGKKARRKKKVATSKKAAAGRKAASTRAGSKKSGGRKAKRKAPPKAAAEPAPSDPHHSVRRPMSAVRNAGGAPAITNGAATLHLAPTSQPEIESRKTRRAREDRESLDGRLENIEAHRPDRRIEGHVRSSVRRQQAARDSLG